MAIDIDLFASAKTHSFVIKRLLKLVLIKPEASWDAYTLRIYTNSSAIIALRILTIGITNTFTFTKKTFKKCYYENDE